MQRASLPEPLNNLLIISWKLDDIYSRTQLWTAVLGKKLFIVMGKLVIGNLLLLGAQIVRFKSQFIRFTIAAQHCRFVFHQRGNRNRSLARSGDVVQAHKPEKICRKANLCVIDCAIAVGKMYSVLCAPFLPLLEHIHHVAAVLMQSQQKPAKCPHAAQKKVAQLLEEFAVEVG